MKEKEYHVHFGKQYLPLQLPAQTKTLEVKEPEKTITPDLFKNRLETCLQNHHLDLSHPIIVLADKTRLCGYSEYLPVLVKVLLKKGLIVENLTFIIAYGTHARQSDAECLEAYGESYNKYTFIHHNCQETHKFEELGQTSYDTPVRYRRDLLNATAIITMGAISHHYFAGYGGGRKLLFPGCGEKEAIYKNHSLYLDKEGQRLQPGCQPGVFRSNPLAQDLFEVESHLNPNLAIHGILNSSGKLCELILGRSKQDFLDVCNLHGNNCETDSIHSDLVIASCGGFPKDINFIQSHKAVHNGAMFVCDGGLLIVYCECRDGLGSKTFLPWFKYDSFAEAFNDLSKKYEGNGGTALAMMTKLQRIRIGLITQLDHETCKLIGVEKWSHEQVVEHLSLSSKESIAYIPNASLLVKKPQSIK